MGTGDKGYAVMGRMHIDENADFCQFFILYSNDICNLST
jgi:hypothetical protein